MADSLSIDARVMNELLGAVSEQLALRSERAGRHLADLQALTPSNDELVQAARWSETHDASEGYRAMLVNALKHFGVTYGPQDA